MEGVVEERAEGDVGDPIHEPVGGVHPEGGAQQRELRGEAALEHVAGDLTTFRPDGWPVTLPLWYVVLERILYVATPPSSEKVGRLTAGLTTVAARAAPAGRRGSGTRARSSR